MCRKVALKTHSFLLYGLCSIYDATIRVKGNIIIIFQNKMFSKQMIQLCLTNIFKFYLLPNIMKFIYNITIITRSIFMILQYITHLPISDTVIQ